MSNLSICQTCFKNPATYGDGVTWSRCSQCQLQYQQKESSDQPTTLSPQEGRPHKRVEGLVSIIMLVHNIDYALFHYTGNAIGSLREHTDKEKTPYEFIVVENGSPIKPPTMQAYYADKVINNETNLGVTVGWNQGIRVSEGEYIVLLNNDTQVYEGWLENLKEVIDNGQTDLAMAHPMYSNTEPFARAVESKKVLEGKYIFDSLDKDFSCVMFKKELYDEVGEFDERFFFYCSDSDFLKRMEQMGKRYLMVDKVATHHVSDATGYAMGSAEIMNEDRRKFEEKWNNQQPQVSEPESTQTDLVVGAGPISEPVVLKFIRSQETGDKIYLVSGNQIHWIRSAEVYKELGGDFGQEVDVSKEQFSEFVRGEPIDQRNIDKYK